MRHAEKAERDLNPGAIVRPGLSKVGKQRAKALATVLRDAGIDVIYVSKSRQRAVQTAEPLAKDLNIAIESNPGRLNEDLVRRLRTQHASDRVLVVSHHSGYRMPALVETFGYAGPSLCNIGYDNLFVIIPKINGAPLVLRLRY